MRKAAVLLLTLLCAFSFAAVACAENLLPFSAMKVDVPDNWRQTFDTVNGPVMIDVAIQLPDRDTLPLLELGFHSFAEDDLAEALPQALIHVDSLRAMVQMGDFAARVYPQSASRCGWTAWPPESEYAENVSLSRAELEQHVLQLVHQLSLPDATDYQVTGVVAHSRTWLVDQDDTPVEPLNDHGYYDAHLQTSVNGVSVIDSFSFDHDNEKLHGPHVEAPQMSYFDDQNYTLCLSGYQITNVLAEDCPLLPFAAIQQEVERLIATGHLREIYRFELCYVPMWADDGQAIVTVPAWVIWGEYHEKATAPTNQEPAGYYQRVIGGYPLVIPAQTGKALDYTNQSRDRWTASTYLTEEGR